MRKLSLALSEFFRPWLTGTLIVTVQIGAIAAYWSQRVPSATFGHACLELWRGFGFHLFLWVNILSVLFAALSLRFWKKPPKECTPNWTLSLGPETNPPTAEWNRACFAYFLRLALAIFLGVTVPIVMGVTLIINQTVSTDFRYISWANVVSLSAYFILISPLLYFFAVRRTLLRSHIFSAERYIGHAQSISKRAEAFGISPLTKILIHSDCEATLVYPHTFPSRGRIIVLKSNRAELDRFINQISNHFPGIQVVNQSRLYATLLDAAFGLALGMSALLIVFLMVLTLMGTLSQP